MVEAKIISSLEKCFIDQKLSDFGELKKARMYRNERFSIQLAACDEDDAWNAGKFYRIEISGPLAPYATVRMVESVPNYLPVHSTKNYVLKTDSDYLRVTPGLYPDVLIPLVYKNKMTVVNQQLHAAWIDFEPSGALTGGTCETKICLYNDKDEKITENIIEIEIIPVDLPEQEMKVTQWFYTDCLANYYNVEPFSDRHFEICENYIKTAVKNGNNMILMPVFTPPLDTEVGGERLTTQLVKVTVDDGAYSFDFSLVDRWLDMCERCNVKYIEVSHLFSQWGAYNAPKIMATADGEYKKIFGWDTDASGEEYSRFLRCFLTEFTAYLEKHWDKGKCFFHISDEPQEEHLEQYGKDKKIIADILKDWKIIDAMSHVEFYKQGLCENPVPCIDRIEPFLNEDIKDRWAYYCGQWIGVSNRMLAMASARTRFIGTQFYKYDIQGFLHWGYNFYNNRMSCDSVNPFLNTNGGYWGPGGDCFIVYPAQDGTALESIRILVLKQAYDDVRAMKLCESFYGKEKVVEEIEKICGMNITFAKCVTNNETMLKIRSRIDDMVLEALK
ncbi:MAG: DUF4091 domain-containing protein [Bacillota bacterium]|nr:DUF4091 domain-containing protein [Bacillota bacterium]